MPAKETASEKEPSEETGPSKVVAPTSSSEPEPSSEKFPSPGTQWPSPEGPEREPHPKPSEKPEPPQEKSKEPLEVQKLHLAQEQQVLKQVVLLPPWPLSVSPSPWVLCLVSKVPLQEGHILS